MDTTIRLSAVHCLVGWLRRVCFPAKMHWATWITHVYLRALQGKSCDNEATHALTTIPWWGNDIFKIPHKWPLEGHLTIAWASCQIRKIAGAHAPGMSGTFSPPSDTSDPEMHHGTCVTHVPWCMPESLTSIFLWSQRRGKTFPAFPAHAQPTILRIWQEAHSGYRGKQSIGVRCGQCHYICWHGNNHTKRKFIRFLYNTNFIYCTNTWRL